MSSCSDPPMDPFAPRTLSPPAPDTESPHVPQTAAASAFGGVVCERGSSDPDWGDVLSGVRGPGDLTSLEPTLLVRDGQQGGQPPASSN